MHTIYNLCLNYRTYSILYVFSNKIKYYYWRTYLSKKFKALSETK